MMVGCRRATPLTSVAARTLGMTGVVQALMHDTILYGNEMAVVGIHVLFGGPAELTVVDDVLRAVLRTESILRDDISVHIIAPDTETDITDDEVLRSAAIDLVMADENTQTRRGLTGDRVVLAVDAQVFDQTYLARYGKANRQRFIRILLHRPAQ